MLERDIRLLFKTGHWKTAFVVPHQKKGWTVLLVNNNKDIQPSTLLSKRGGPRLFKTSDAALIWCQNTGFDSVKVHLVSQHQNLAERTVSNINGASILIIEDDENDIELTRHALRKNNITQNIIIKRDGVEALAYLFQDFNNNTRLPCLILLDLKLPKLSGLEVLEQIRNNEAFNTIPVVVLSTSNVNNDIQNSYKLGSNSFIRKPNNSEDYKNVIKQLGAYWTEINLIPA